MQYNMCILPQNCTRDNRTQGIMEKSQWDLKKICFQRRQLTRLDDFVHTYKITLKGLPREYTDYVRRKRKVKFKNSFALYFIILKFFHDTPDICDSGPAIGIPMSIFTSYFPLKKKKKKKHKHHNIMLQHVNKKKK